MYDIYLTITFVFFCLFSVFFLLHPHTPVWEDLAVWPSGAWSRATNPLLGACLKSSPPKLNFSSAFCQTDEEKSNLYGVHPASVGLLSTFTLMWYLEHTGGKEGLTLHMLRDLKRHTQVIAWKKKTASKGKETWITLLFNTKPRCLS